jgi:hypothetical protein
MPVFAPGSDVEEATQHDFDVLNASPSTVELSYLSRTEKEATGVARGWYDLAADQQFCGPSPRPTGKECDEHPFYSSDKGGPLADGSVRKDQLRLIDKDHNGREGTMLEGFYSVCGIKSEPAGSPARRCLVIPLPQQQDVPTTAYCRAGAAQGPRSDRHQ